VEARSRGQGGENLVGVNATRGSASETPGNTGLGGTDPRDAQILGAATDDEASTRKQAGGSGRETARRAGRAETPGPLPAGENPLKAKILWMAPV
jgi:hypothetical protein